MSPLAWRQFDAAMVLSTHFQRTGEQAFDLDQLQGLDESTRAALEQLMAGSIQIEADGGFRQLTLDEVQQMPIVTVAEAALLLEVNTDFFIQALPKLLETRNQLMQSIGSALRSS
ncbi:hypothetical protein [Paracidovorax wautersii]|uniref:hypothetical protein n=1 Tax=Paracidovorax wautersii TaxID=1177982 RepID=UPI0031D06288